MRRATRIQDAPLPFALRLPMRAQKVQYGPIDERRLVREYIGNEHDQITEDLPPMPRGVNWALTDGNYRVARVNDQSLRSGDWVVYGMDSDEPIGVINEATFRDLMKTVTS